MNQDIINFIEWTAGRDFDWYFKDKLWHKDGCKTRTTEELFEYWMRDQIKKQLI